MQRHRGYRLTRVLMCAFVLIAFAVAAGCKDKVTEPPSAVPAKKTRAPKASAAEGVTTAPGVSEAYSYNPVGKVDPFQPLFSQDSSKKTAAVPGGSTIQTLELTQLTLVGTIMGKDPAALVQDSAGRGYILRKGTRIGSRQGVVTSILVNRITVTEKTKDFLGKTKEHRVTLRIGVRGEGE